MRPYRTSTGLKSRLVFLREKEKTHRGTGKKSMGRQRQSLKWCNYKSRNPGDARHHQKLGRGKEGFFSIGFRGSMALSTAWFQTSSLLNCERIDFCCLKPPRLWYRIMAALGNWYTPSLFVLPFVTCFLLSHCIHPASLWTSEQTSLTPPDCINCLSSQQLNKAYKSIPYIQQQVVSSLRTESYLIIV